ncbi:MAG TPA: fumarylacetoacetate hydrolase family protein, partial [Streptosporangiaceae bacterium]|nr:fumarylacetoacetate hydrolase family protein [Streptosporangiaceae bacterium]
MPAVEGEQVRGRRLIRAGGGEDQDGLAAGDDLAYFSNPAAVIGPYDDVPIAPDSMMFDYELEIAAVIGRPGATIPLAQAEDHIAGYMLLCDWSARDLQMNE